MNKLLSRLMSNWSACCSLFLKPKATRSSRIVSYRTKTNLAVERCEPRLALDASQVPESQPIDDGFLEVIQPAPAFTLSSNAGGRLSGQNVFANGGVINYADILSESGSVNVIVASPSSTGLRLQTNDPGGFPLSQNFDLLNTGTDLGDSAWDQAVVPLDTASRYSHFLVYEGPPTNRQENFSDKAAFIGTNTSLDVGASAAKVYLGMTDEFASGEFSIPKLEVSSNDSVQGSLRLLSQFEPTEVSSVGEKQPKASNEGSSLTTSLAKHHHTDPAVLHVSSLQTISFDSARPVVRADQVFAVLASNDGTQVAMPQSQTARGEPSSTGFLDVQATIAGIDSAQKTLFNAVVFDTENGSSLFEENALHGNTNSMPVMARATLFEVAEHRVHSSPREVLRGHDGHEKATDGGKTVAIPTLPHDTLVASGDSDNWASSDLSLYVRLSLAAAFATTTFELDKRYQLISSSFTKTDDVNPKQKRVLR